jgi:nicotinate-nucleotide adenylyltransferase
MRIGILGGTFNPVHNGHLAFARQARRRLRLDKVVFVPVNTPPHKPRTGILPARERYKMVRMAIEGRPDFEISDYEIRRPGPSYSVKTLEFFRKRYGKAARLFFLAGADSLKDLKDWKDLKRILSLADFVVAKRSGYKITKFAGVKALRIKTPDISSSLVRSRIKNGLGIKGLVPQTVCDYITKKDFYR